MHPAPECPYCKQPSVFTPSSASIYNGTDRGPVYICRPCQAWVGCHKGTTMPLGRLADKELRRWKIRAHNAFDPLWQAKVARGFRKRAARDLGYNWLAGELGIKWEECHIGMFDVEMCKRVVEICAPYLERLRV